jgi:hypothetical protein
LDDIDDDGNVKNKAKKEISKADGGQREFINLGSQARVGASRPEEEKNMMSRPSGVKPTFKGKLNLNRGNEEPGAGGNTNYDFKVSYNTSNPGEQKVGKPREKGVPFERHMAEKAEDEDEGFEVVKDIKARKQRMFKRSDDSSDSEDAPSDGTKITRGDTRTRGTRGGFFKNSKRDD